MNSSDSKTKKQAKDALDRFKMEVASEIGVPLKEGYNGDLTTSQAGSVGGEMVRKMIRAGVTKAQPTAFSRAFNRVLVWFFFLNIFKNSISLCR